MSSVLLGSSWSRVRIVVVASVFLGYGLAPVLASEPSRKPRVRAITAFVRIEPTRYRQQIDEAVSMLRQAKAAFENGGYTVQTIRITTQPFSEYLGERSLAEALEFFKDLDELSRKDGFMLDVGPLDPTSPSGAAKIELLSQVLVTTRASASLVAVQVRTECIGTQFMLLHKSSSTSKTTALMASTALILRRLRWCRPTVRFSRPPTMTAPATSFRSAGNRCVR